MAKKFSKIPADYSAKKKVVESKSKTVRKEAKSKFREDKPLDKPKRYSTFELEGNGNYSEDERKRNFKKDRVLKSLNEKGSKGNREFENKKPRSKNEVASTYKHAKGPKSFDAKDAPKKGKVFKKRSKEEENLYSEKKIINTTKSKAGDAALASKTALSVEQMPLNKFLSQAGICSRREAVELIKKGRVKVNGLVEVNPAVKVGEADYVIYDDKRLHPQRKLVYYLLNKPKDYITTTDDPEGRKTVLDLFKGVEDKRIFPVGRLDRNTTGLLLLTNDGELAQKLSHPKHNTVKVYQVGLNKSLDKEHFQAIVKGTILEDGLALVDELAYTNPKDKAEIGIQIHIGRNRIVRRLFEHFGYQVKTLDRVIYAGLTKKNLPRGKWRELSEKEVIYLKHFK